MSRAVPFFVALLLCVVHSLGAENPVPATLSANRLTYLDESDPFYVGMKFPKLTTPQWVGEAGVECVVILGIDDMGADCQPYERVLRPVLERLKQIDGRAPVSIFCNNVKPDEPHLLVGKR